MGTVAAAFSWRVMGPLLRPVTVLGRPATPLRELCRDMAARVSSEATDGLGRPPDPMGAMSSQWEAIPVHSTKDSPAQYTLGPASIGR